MFDSLGRIVARAPLRTVAVWVLLTAACLTLAILGVRGETLFERLSTGQPEVPGSESSEADRILAEQATSGSALSLVVQGAPVDTDGLADAVADVREDLLRIDGVGVVIDPFLLPDGPQSPAAAALVAADGDGFLVVVELEPGLDAPTRSAALEDVEQTLRATPDRLGGAVPGVPGATGQVGGESLIVDEIVHQIEEDLRTGEAIALPVALVIMVLVFGGFLAASMPMAGALASIAGGLGALYGLSGVLDLDASTVNVVTLLGLGLSIDYGLLVVSRFREELHRLLDDVPPDEATAPAPSHRHREGRRARRRRDPLVETALRRTLQTAGRTVAFSAVTVAISVAGLLVFRPEILRAFGAAGVAVILVAVATALTLVPALLRLAGRRLVRPGLVHRVPGGAWLLQRTGDVSREEGVFSALAARVQRRPWWVLGGVVVLLAVLAVPLGRIELRNSTIELLPAGSAQRAYVETIAASYPASAAPAVVLVAQAPLDEVAGWAQDLERIDAVASVDPPSPLGSYTVLGIRPADADPGGAVARDAVQGVRDTDAPFPTWVTGQAANQMDFVSALAERAPAAVAVVVVATFLLLFLMTGSVVIPAKALLTNTVSIAASLGVLVWVFQDGNLSGVLGFVPTGGIETYVVALIVAFAFGLAMDYEVFLLSRIKELHDAGHANDDAVRLGLQRSGRIITSAALVIIVVFTGFMFGELLVIKEVGFALAVAVLVDATLVRMLLVPASMTLLGRYNWWAPAPLRALHRRFAIEH